MARWLAAAEPVAVEKAHNACRAGPELPANQSALDMVTYYEDVEDFQDIAKGIPPMMTDIRVRVGCGSHDAPCTASRTHTTSSACNSLAHT
jgi:hypothetical protein